MPDSILENILSTSSFIKKAFELDKKPKSKIALILGSGLSEIADAAKYHSLSSAISYGDLPNFPKSTVVGHKGELIYGLIDNTPLFILSGRLHRYEGHKAQDVIFPLRVLKTLGIEIAIITNMSGAMGDNFAPGDLMIITDHINLTGDNPLIGPNIDSLGPRFFDMGEAYNKSLIELALIQAKKTNITLHPGVYAGVLGPNYETPAEIRMLKSFGAHAVGMSTVFEVIAARHMGIKVLAISCLSNMAAGLSNNHITHEEVSDMGKHISGKLKTLLEQIINNL